MRGNQSFKESKIGSKTAFQARAAIDKRPKRDVDQIHVLDLGGGAHLHAPSQEEDSRLRHLLAENMTLAMAVTRRLAEIEAVVGLVPLPLPIDQRDQRDRRIERGGGDACVPIGPSPRRTSRALRRS